jgi:hypothetical protein
MAKKVSYFILKMVFLTATCVKKINAKQYNDSAYLGHIILIIVLGL